MQHYDVFNGDADGICALLQLHLHQPRDSQLITGVKRDIALLQQIPLETCKDSQITVLDISLDKNRQPLLDLLDNGANIFYADHHFAGEIPQHANLKTHINTQANACTSLIINSIVEQKFYPWAIVGAYGDNLFQAADALADTHGLSNKTKQQLKQLGTVLNYNGYGASLADLHQEPAKLFKSLRTYQQPIDYIHDDTGSFESLNTGFIQDNDNAKKTVAHHQTDKVAVFILDNAKWARRISGVYGNQLANNDPNRAHAVLTPNDDGYFTVSVRAPLNNKTGADDLCRQFPSGGGRKAAAGINQLPLTDLDLFIEKFSQQYL